MQIRVPTIPTNIVVHLGPPDEAAKNITVPFVEYIKNVASSEIYPNWPTDAIKANILAQISFALNRVYNEWYRSQGYNFDITSSPIYDQMFIEDREFYEVITEIVDNIFNNYIIKDDQVQPLFAQYCDGKTVTCEGLSQWGSVKLAGEGKSPLDILKYYYGDNIKLIYNAPVEENIMSYPGFPLKVGTAGDMVRIIKTQLNRISNNYPEIPKILDESEYYTVETEAAVKKFQEIFNLIQNGEVDKETWYKIKYIYNAVKKISDLYSEGISKEEATLLFSKVLQKGDTGYYINTLNYLISTIAYFDKDIPLLNLTDTYNQNTIDMVMAFQEKYHLPVTGIVDAATWKIIKEVYEKTINTLPKEYLIYEDEFYPGLFLSKGMDGEPVRRLQMFLLKICRKNHSIPGVRVTGVFDTLTEQSVKKIQKDANIPVSGVVGPASWYRIVELSKE